MKNSFRIHPGTLYLVLSGSIGLWLLADALWLRLVTFSQFADYWEHSAALTEWMRDLGSPGNPHLADDSSSARYMPFFFLLTVIGKAFGLDAIDLMGLSALISYALIVLGIWLFSRAYFNDRWAPIVAYIVLFMGWGIAWNWSNLYQLRSFFHGGGYPSSFVFGLSLISFWLVLKSLRGDLNVITAAVAMAVMAALMFLCHPLTAVFGIAGSALLLLTVRGATRKMRIAVLSALVFGPIVAELWPYFSVWSVSLASSGSVERSWGLMGQGIGPLEYARSMVWYDLFYHPPELLVALGAILLGIPIWFWLLIKRQQPFIVWGAALMSLPYFGNIFFQIALGHRFLLFAVFFLHLGMIWAVLQLLAAWKRASSSGAITTPLRIVATVTAALFVIAFTGNVALLAAEYAGVHIGPSLKIIQKRARLPAGQSVVELYQSLAGDLPDSAIVMARAYVGWPLPTIRGKVISLYQENSLVLNQEARTLAVAEFFDPETGAADRAALSHHLGVTHVLIDEATTPDEVLRWLDDYATQTAAAGSFRMLQLEQP